MSESVNSWIDILNEEGLPHAEHGIERECLRVDSNGLLSLNEHPKSLGSALCHPNISTDFSEAQLELITPVFKSEIETLKFLSDIHSYISKEMKDELIWAFSTPCTLPSSCKIPIAKYGNSKRGIEKYIYRRGLAHRYGRRMQTLSGLHYNFSMPDSFWEKLNELSGLNTPLKKIKTGGYLHIARNFLRFGWLNTFLFGATPAIDQSYLDMRDGSLEKIGDHTFLGKEACSLRMSEYGYYSKIQAQTAISYNSLKEYLRDMHRVISKEAPDFLQYNTTDKKGPLQLNSNLLQVPAEHYSRIRPKPSGDGLDPLNHLEKGGVQYLEIRAIDLDPFSPDGIEIDQLRFLHTFLLYCLFEDSPNLQEKEERDLTHNQNIVSLKGRNPDLMLKRSKSNVPLKEWASDLLLELEKVAILQDKHSEGSHFQKCIKKQIEKLNDYSQLSSSLVLREVQKANNNYQEFGKKLSMTHTEELKKRPITKKFQEKMKMASVESLEEQAKIEAKEDFFFDGFNEMEISTRSLIKEALSRGAQVDVLDKKDQVIKISYKGATEYVKQATITSKDNLVSYFLMENKSVTKHILENANIPVAWGKNYQDESSAIKEYSLFTNKKLVVKPSHTNFGVGIEFIEPNSEKEFSSAIKNALSYGNQVLVEEFIPGNEYRILTINYKVAAACRRVPANVVGNGKDSIEKLVKDKNEDPRNYKYGTYQIRIGKTEKAYLATLDLTPSSIPKAEERVYLRENSNVSTGGDAWDYTDKIHPKFYELAIEASKKVNANFCGLDIIIEDPTKEPNLTKHAFIELNFNPALYLHRYPTLGKKQYVEKQVFDVLFSPK